MSQVQYGVNKPVIRISKSKRKAYAEGIRVQLQDEARTIGSGWRTLQIIKEGRKWVRVEEVSTGRRARFDVRTWQKIMG